MTRVIYQQVQAHKFVSQEVSSGHVSPKRRQQPTVQRKKQQALLCNLVGRNHTSSYAHGR
ncbi:unnamed protein product [Sphagnum troendelagicum]|uniref:Uncharacterized protein n=1 Tax=Sphagnum troendelagicum TaxID=128251 RepID=A0ABP0U508_9BRYO